MEEMQMAIDAATTPIVRIWLNWMVGIFLLSILFVWKHKAARFVLAAFILSVPIALAIFKMTNSVHLIGIAHIVVWGPLAFYLIKYELKASHFQIKSPYGIWTILLLSTIIISLLFDFRDVALVMLGRK